MHPMLFNPARGGDFAFRALCGQIPTAGLHLDAAGWAEVAYLLRALKAEGHLLSRFEFERFVLFDPAQRFALSADKQRIRVVPEHATKATTPAAMVAVE
jgi:putative RNA 2'-phosphotransferase